MPTKKEHDANYKKYSQGLRACQEAYLLGAGWKKVENPRDHGCCWVDPTNGFNCYLMFAVTTQARRDVGDD
jgi:hypothetical protein